MDPYMRHHVGTLLLGVAVLIVGGALLGGGVEAASVVAFLGLALVLYSLVKAGLHLMRDDYRYDAQPPQ